jgi:hypothetical protein
MPDNFYYLMHKFSTIFFVLIFSAFSFSCFADIPLAIKAAFKKKFPTAEKVKWEPGVGQFAAEFRIEKKVISAKFDDSGNLIETEELVSMSDLPQVSRELIETRYANEKIKEIKKVIRNRGWVFYKVKLKDAEILFDAQGLQFFEEEHVEEASEPVE